MLKIAETLRAVEVAPQTPLGEFEILAGREGPSGSLQPSQELYSLPLSTFGFGPRYASFSSSLHFSQYFGKCFEQTDRQAFKFSASQRRPYIQRRMGRKATTRWNLGRRLGKRFILPYSQVCGGVSAANDFSALLVVKRTFALKLGSSRWCFPQKTLRGSCPTVRNGPRPTVKCWTTRRTYTRQ